MTQRADYINTLCYATFYNWPLLDFSLGKKRVQICYMAIRRLFFIHIRPLCTIYLRRNMKQNDKTTTSYLPIETFYLLFKINHAWHPEMLRV